MKYWVSTNGSLGKGADIEQGAVEIGADVFQYLVDNQTMFIIQVVDGAVSWRINMAAYRRAALARLENVNFITFQNVKVYDDELPYLGPSYFLREGGPCRISQDQMIRLVTERNRIYTLRRSGIQTAKTPEEVDGYLTCPTI